MNEKSKVWEVSSLLIVPIVLVFCVLWQIEQAAFLSLIIVITAMVPFFSHFERKKPRPRDITPIVVLSAIAAAGRLLFRFFPNFKPVSAIVILAGATFGRKSGFLTGTLSALVSNMFFGQGLWTPWQMYAWGLIGYMAGILEDHGWLKHRISIYLYGMCATLCYGLILDSYYAIGFLRPFTAEGALLAYLAGFPFTLSHAVATVAFLIPIYHPWKRKLSRIKQKFGLLS